MHYWRILNQTWRRLCPKQSVEGLSRTGFRGDMEATGVSKQEVTRRQSRSLWSTTCYTWAKFLGPGTGRRSSCNRIPEEFIRLADPELFKNYNWPRAIHGYLLNNLDTLAKKQKSPPEAMSYLNGCTHVLLIWIFEHIQIQIPTFPERRPRIKRWTSIKTFALTRSMLVLQNIKTTQVFTQFEEILEDNLLLYNPNDDEHGVKERKKKKKLKRMEKELEVEEKVKKKKKQRRYKNIVMPVLKQIFEEIRSLDRKMTGSHCLQRPSVSWDA
ncbi:hypothetical protein KSP40_PGU008782 [Platanthera guangdongensis]|uniref:Uncharacterized protein n=1 Tax=Platanthera guangdongensis TaxID=2320717 RepID=A0ABR2MX86_9ASPA